MARPLNLDVNDAGAWRRVTKFDLDDFEGDSLRSQIEQLLARSTCANVKARLVIPGDTAPLWTWSKAAGWEAWKEATT